MLKIFLVEDEFVVREGIKNNIDWAAHGYEFVGEATDGELAFPMIQKLKPDIVITDIKMPFMNGLELGKLIKKEFPWMEIIILSGYAEFDYAKEAISMGAAHYLTKPISGDELIGEIDKLAQKIEKRRLEIRLREKYLKEMEENTREDKKRLFLHMIMGDKNITELIEQAGRLNMDISAIYYNIVLLKIMSSGHTKEEYSQSIVEAWKDISEVLEQKNILIFDRGIEGKAIIYKGDTPEELQKLQENTISSIKEVLKKYPSIEYFGGIGEPVGRLRELNLSFESASHAFAHRYFLEENEILKLEDLQKNYHIKSEEFNISRVDPREVDRKRIIEFLKQGEQDETVYFIGELFNNLGESAVLSNIFRQYIAMDTYFAVAGFVEEMGHNRNEIEEFNILEGKVDSVEGTAKYLCGIIDKALEIRNTNANKKYNDVVERMMEYIDEHYGDEELSLNFLASHFNFSPNHLSMMFNKQMGVSFIKYLTDYRMNKAKELLRCTNKRSLDISLEVGYKDPHYFSYCFKKYQGITPTQYRNKAGVEDAGND